MMKLKKCLLLFSLAITGFTFAQTGLTINDSIYTGGIYRKYILYVPTSYTANPTEVPLILSMHGFSGNSNQQMQFADFRPIADTANFIVAHAQGLTQTMNYGVTITGNGWSVFGNPSEGDADRAFLNKLVDTIKANYQINTNKVYATGFSQGGFISQDLAAFSNSNFAAIAAVSATMVQSHYDGAAPTRPTPVMMIHGTKDPLIGYYGPSSTSGIYQNAVASLPVETILGAWISFNKCSTIADSTILPVSDINNNDQSTVSHYTYSGGLQGTTVELYKVNNGGHTWPTDGTIAGETGTVTMFGNTQNQNMTLGNRNKDFNACKEIWRFFNQYSLSSTDTNVGPFEGPTPTSTTINNASINNNVNIYPNPSNGLFYLNIGSKKDAHLTITNLLGEKIKEVNIVEQKTTLQLNITGGVYFYEVKNETELLKTGKIIVE